jgi:hypothetical protein
MVFGVINGVIGDALAGIQVALERVLAAELVGDDLNDDVRGLAHAPLVVGPALFDVEVLRTGHVQAQQTVRGHGRRLFLVEPADVGQHQEGPPHARAGPTRIQRVRQQAVQLLDQDALHRLVVFGHQVVVARFVLRFRCEARRDDRRHGWGIAWQGAHGFVLQDHLSSRGSYHTGRPGKKVGRHLPFFLSRQEKTAQALGSSSLTWSHFAPSTTLPSQPSQPSSSVA